MYLLDTDHMSILERGGSEGAKIRGRLRVTPRSDIATSIVSYEEQTRGWLAHIARATAMPHQVEAYRRLRRQLENYCSTTIIDYDSAAAAEFERLRTARIRIGTLDLRIAAIALANNITVLTRNLSHFRQVPGLRAED